MQKCEIRAQNQTDAKLLVSEDGERTTMRLYLESFFPCLAQALRYIYSQATRHMDIKPSNILVKTRPQVLVRDEGSTSSSRTLASAINLPTFQEREPKVSLQKPRNTVRPSWYHRPHPRSPRWDGDLARTFSHSAVSLLKCLQLSPIGIYSNSTSSDGTSTKTRTAIFTAQSLKLFDGLISSRPSRMTT